MRKFALLLFILVIPPPAHSQMARQGRAFLMYIYAWDTNDQADGPLADSKAYTPSLIRLIKEDQRRAGKGNIGNLDYDPLCSCQDPGGLSATVTTVHLQGAGHASAAVSLASPGKLPDILRFDLRWTAHGWRINDLHTALAPSLRAFLRKP